MKKTWLLLLSVLAGGCTIINEKPPIPGPVIPENEAREKLREERVCVVPEAIADFETRCDMAYWLGLWVEADAMRWSQRKAAITALGNSLPDKLHKIVLSLPVDTPYQDRLRAQSWLSEVQVYLTEQMQTLVDTLVESPNTQLLEFESAISLMSRVNTQQAQTIENLKEELEAQRKKLEELLQIEATLMDKNRSSQQ